MQPLQFDLRFSAAKHNSMPAAAAARNLDVAIPLRSAEHTRITHKGYTNGSCLQLQNRIVPGERA